MYINVYVVVTKRIVIQCHNDNVDFVNKRGDYKNESEKEI